MPDLPPPTVAARLSQHASPRRRTFEENLTPPVSPRFDVGRSRSGPTKIPPLARFSGHRSAVRPPFSTPPASEALSHRC
ncbi:hypothetical protein PanWU01x14_058330 [Parasponia andersonii]|uniref:Uncharacterized protein n=1 Tax=Parasponia andersonii TaxID=3476 RepID=A0A2P5DJ62_PARAD|nr:hypothetical protein PanWU01x14_058330 [Parasponia andersonii]